MTSINTNIAAQTALRTLQSTNAALDTTQSRISTGLKIGEAKDNAAYWSISTSLKSDNKAMGAVKDALGLGAATVDTAYRGLNQTLEVLDEIKSKIMTAQQSGLPRSVIQAEIGELQKQLQSIANSSIFSGENWLSINSDVPGFSAQKEVVASFTRDANNAVSIGKVGVDITSVALFDSSASVARNGILDGAISLKGQDGRDLDLGAANVDGNRLLGGLADTAAGAGRGAAATTGTAVPASSLGASTGPGTASTRTYGGGGVTGLAISGSTAFAANDTIVVTFTGGRTATLTLTNTTAAEANTGTLTWATLATATLGGSGGQAFTMAGDANGLVLTSTTNGTLPPTIASVAATTLDASDNPAVATPTQTASAAGSPAVATATAATVSTGNLTVADFAIGDKVSVTLNVNGTRSTFTTDPLVAANGTAIQLSDIATALDGKFAGIADVAVSGTALEFTAHATGAKTVFSLEKLTALNGADAGKTIANGIGSENTAGAVETDSFAALTLDADDNIYLKVAVDGGAAKEVRIDRALVNRILARETGAVANVAEWKQVVDAALADSGVTGVTTAVTNTDKLTFTSATAGANSGVAISTVRASAGADTVSVMTLNISDAGLAAAGASTGAQISNLLSAYVSAVSETITKVTNAASTLGSVASRIEIQQTFVSNLMDTIEKGISGLIDADMNEESTRLQALQVKQQLGVQALSIANQSAQNVLRLFQ